MEHRMKPALPAALLLSGTLLLVGCGFGSQGYADSPITRMNNASQVPQSQAVSLPPIADLPTIVEEIADDAVIGGMLIDRRTGQLLLAVNPDRTFRSASLVKLLIAMDALDRDPDSDRTSQLVRTMLVESNDEIASMLWVEGGGARIVTTMAQRIGLTGTMPPADPGMWGYTPTTARDVAEVYRYLMSSAPARQRELIVRALAETRERAADGWLQYFGIPDAMDEPWAVKQGWSDAPGDLVVHSTGLVGENWRYIVVLMVQAPAGDGWAPLRDAVTAAAEALEPAIAG
jgi:hypothetical protein